MSNNEKEQKKLLVITYYWPPSGGAGVLRWLMLSKCLSDLGYEVHVLTVDPTVASFSILDTASVNKVDDRVQVFTTNSFEPVSIYSKLVGKDKVPTAGFSNVDNSSRKQQAITWLRSNLFHPDPRIGWKSYAVKKASALIKEHGYQAIITTSPPHSVQLIGRSLKRKFPKLFWIADLRDPWTDIYYYDILKKSTWARWIDRKMELSVLQEADHILTISEGFRQVFLNKLSHQAARKFSIVPNGFLAQDFSVPPPPKDKDFTITYTGTIADSYDPYSFLEVVAKLQQNFPERDIKLKFVGILDAKIKAFCDSKQVNYEYFPPVSHEEIICIQRSAHLLLLVSPKMKTGDFIIPGKAFEYLAAGPPIIGLAQKDSETAKLLLKTKAGKCFARPDRSGMEQYLSSVLKNYPANRSPAQVMGYSRSAQAQKIADIINKKV